MKPPLDKHLDLLITAALAILCYVMFFHQLGGIGLIGPDEPRYAAVAREMFLTGDYVTPRLHGEPWFEKPVLMYWLAAAGYGIFGISEQGARFPSTLSAVVSIFLVYWCGRRLWSRTAGFLAAVILVTSIGFFSFARAASMDMLLTASLTMALVFFLAGYNDVTTARRWWFYACYASLGLGVLAKGPIAFVLPALALGTFLIYQRKWSEWKTWHPEGILAALAVALPWYVACTWTNGMEFIDVFVVNQNFQRFVSSIHGHERPFYFFVPVLLLLSFPWTFLLIPALGRRLGKNELIMAAWAAVPFVVFSFSGSKLPGYILPMLPPIALLCARELQQTGSRAFKVAVFAEAATMAFIGVAFGLYGNLLNVDPHVSGLLIAIVTFALAAILVAVGVWLTPAFLAGVNAVAIVLIVFVATNLVFSRVDRTDTMRPWDAALSRFVSADEVVFMYKPRRWMEYGLQFYRSNNARGVFSPEETSAVSSANSRVLFIAEDENLDELNRIDDLEMEVVHTIGNLTAFWVWRPAR